MSSAAFTFGLMLYVADRGLTVPLPEGGFPGT
jgi:hypothetical protein